MTTAAIPTRRAGNTHPTLWLSLAIILAVAIGGLGGPQRLAADLAGFGRSLFNTAPTTNAVLR